MTKPRQRTDSYWQRRSEQRLSDIEKQAKSYLEAVRKAYDEASIKATEQLKHIYEVYYSKNGFDLDELNSIAPNGSVEKFLEEMKRKGLEVELPNYYKGRVSRLELINAQMEAIAKEAAATEEVIDNYAFHENYRDSYYHAAYDVAKAMGGTPSSFAVLDTRAVEKVLKSSFQGKNFSTRIWGNSDILAKTLKEELATAIANGQSIQKTAKGFRERFDVQKYYAERLIRTETNHFHNEAEIDSYKSMGFEKYRFLATLDMKTSDICQSMDRKLIPIDEAVPGENVPPLHPNCRSTITPYAKDFESRFRRYRDPKTGKNKMTYNISYEEWLRQVNDGSLQEVNSVSNKKVQGKSVMPDQTGLEPHGKASASHYEPPKTTSLLDETDTKKNLEERKVEYKAVQEKTKKDTTAKVIEKVGGGDLTYGSCASLALAYAGNKAGYEVRDFRGGASQKFFASSKNFKKAMEDIGVKYGVESNTNDFSAVHKLMKDAKLNTEYLLSTGRHASIIKKTKKNGWQYLELQSSKSNGYQKLDDYVFSRRFGCQKSHSSCGQKIPIDSYLIDIKEFKKNNKFKELLGYINTNEDKQLKGETGRAK